MPAEEQHVHRERHRAERDGGEHDAEHRARVVAVAVRQAHAQQQDEDERPPQVPLAHRARGVARDAHGVQDEQRVGRDAVHVALERAPHGLVQGVPVEIVARAREAALADFRRGEEPVDVVAERAAAAAARGRGSGVVRARRTTRFEIWARLKKNSRKSFFAAPRRAGAIIHPRDRRAAARHLARTPLVVRSMAAARIALPVPARVARPRVGAEKTTEAPSSRPSVAAASARAMATRSNINSRSSHLASVVATRALPQSHHDGKTCALTTSVIAPTVAEALTEIDEAVAGGADIVELRVDFIPTLDADGKDLTAMLERCPVPCIVTYRPTWEGGQYAGEEEPRLAALWKAVELGAAYVDCELLAAERFVIRYSRSSVAPRALVRPRVARGEVLLAVPQQQEQHVARPREIRGVRQQELQGRGVPEVLQRAVQRGHGLAQRVDGGDSGVAAGGGRSPNGARPPLGERARDLGRARAERVSTGAVNTLVKRPDGTFKGYNTDYVAAIDAIEAAMNAKRGTASGEVLRGKTVVVVGAGGAGRGLAFGAKFKGADVIVANRSLDRAQALATACGGVAVTLEALASGAVKGDVLANTTSVGMTPNVDETPTPKSAIAAGGFDVVFDAVYNPLETKLLRDAKEVGCELASGLDMFVGQAALQFELFTGKDADAATRERMKRAVLDSM